MSSEAESTSALIERMRAFEADHVPDGWPCIRMRDITALCDAVEAARAAALEEAAEIVSVQEQYRNAIRTVQRCRNELRRLGVKVPGQTS